MKLFIRDAYLRLLPSQEKPDLSSYTEIPRADPEFLEGRCLLTDARTQDLHQVLFWLEQNRLQKLDELICLSHNAEALKDFVKKEFRVIRAAGGLVKKGNQFLLIHRLGRWDLPKGKLEKGEKMKDAALREVEEECNIKASRGRKICNTWHSYNLDGKRILKKTAWYTMNCQEDKKMKPQKEEGIDDIRWMSREEAEKALQFSYRSIQAVFDAYLEQENLSADMAFKKA